MKRMFFSLCLAAIMPALAIAEVEMRVNRIAVTGATEIIIDGKCLDIDITGVSSDTLALEAGHLDNSIQIKSKRNGSRLIVWVEGDFPIIPIRCLGKLVVTAPRSTIVHVENSAGDILIRNISSSSITAHTLSGTMDIKNCAGPLYLKNIAGSLKIDRCDGPKGIECVSGALSIENSRGSIAASSVSGSMDFDNILGNIKAKTISGSIQIDHTTGSLDLRSVSGALQADGILCTGYSAFESTSGSISVDFANPLRDFTFDLYSMSGALTVGTTDTKKEFRNGSGKIVIYGKTISGDQEYQ